MMQTLGLLFFLLYSIQLYNNEGIILVKILVMLLAIILLIILA